MKNSDFVRFALILSDGQASTFKKNLTKIVKLILFDCYGTPLTIGEMIKRAKGSYSLEFSNAEINDAIKKDRTNIFIEIRDTNDSVYFTYTIAPEEYEKIREKDTTDFFSNIATRFVDDCCKDCCYTIKEIKGIVFRYLYYVFNSDINTVLSLMDYKGTRLISETPYEHFTEAEILLLNAFLNWDNIDKNQFIFNSISSCYEYCMMTIKKDNTSFASIFNGKEFYLDANVIFRLAGFNNSERREVVESFLRKCKECGIKIKHTNFTSIELNSTLTYQVDVIRKLFNGQAPICLEAMQSMSTKYANLDFYSSYVEWAKISGHKASYYSGFLNYLKREVDKHLQKISFVTFESHEKRGNTDFQRLCDDFKTFKEKRSKGTYEGSIKIDIENYLYMQQLDSKAKFNSFLKKKSFFITTDHSLVDWAKEKTPGAVPTFVLPSVWYSLMLKYKGRTDNDYIAFCQFLNLRISSPEDKLAEKREQILAYVIGIDESASIKEEIIFDINQRLLDEKTDIIDIETYVEESRAKITEEKIKTALDAAEKLHSEEKDAILNAYQLDAEYKKSNGLEEGKAIGFSEGIDAAIHSQAMGKLSRNRNIRIAGLIISIIFIVAFVLVVVFAIATGSNDIISDNLVFLNDSSTLIAILLGCISAISFLVSQLNKLIDILSLDIEKVETKLKKKHEKQMRKLS